ncbi:MAG TPA: hypothetical protein VF212_11705 [Longimicrobiales bacterium]
MRRTFLSMTVLAALAAGGAPVPIRSAFAAQVEVNLARAKAVLPAAAALELERAVAAARERGLPTAPLVDKALEGAAKGVPAERILAVVRQLSDELGRARELVAGAGDVTPADITAVADALRRGVPEDAVRSLRADAAGDEPIALAAHTLADLLDRGVPVDVAIEVLGAWRSHGARPDELRELPAAVERLIREGVLPAQAAEAVASAVRAGRGPGSAAGPPAAPGARGKGKGIGPPDKPPLPPGAPPPGKGKGNGNPKKPGGG